MKESVKLQCRVDDLIKKEWRESEILNAEMITEALLLIIDDLVDDIDDEDELSPILEMLEEVAGNVKSKIDDLKEEMSPCMCKMRFKRCDPFHEHDEEAVDENVVKAALKIIEKMGAEPVDCKVRFRKYMSFNDEEDKGCQCSR